MSVRTDLMQLLSHEPHSVSSLARALRLTKREVEDHLRHMIRSARAAGHDILVEPARCRTCGFVFADDRLVKPGKCPECRESRIIEAMLRLE